MLVWTPYSLLLLLTSPAGLCKSWVWAWIWAVYSLHLWRTREPSLQSDAFSNLSASGSAISHTSSGPTPVFSFIGTESRPLSTVCCAWTPVTGQELSCLPHSTASVHPFLWFSFFVCLLFLSLLMPFLLSPSFQCSGSGLCPYRPYQSFITYLVNRTKCCLWIYSKMGYMCLKTRTTQLMVFHTTWHTVLGGSVLFLLYSSLFVNQNWGLNAQF